MSQDVFIKKKEEERGRGDISFNERKIEYSSFERE